MVEIARFFREGGPLVYVNSITWLFAIGIVVDRLIALLFRLNINAGNFMSQIQKFIIEDKIESAIKVCNALPSAALPKVMKAGLTRASKSAIEIQNAIEEAELEVVPEIQKRTPSLWTLANLATLLGLLGTIFGLIDCFRAVGEAAAEQKAQVLSRGISEAMNNTAFGLLIAIFCMVFHLILTGISKRMVEEIDQYSVKLQNLLIARLRHSQAK